VSAPARRSPARGLTAPIAALTALPALSVDMSLPALPQLADGFGDGAGDVRLTIMFGGGALACGVGILGFAAVVRRRSAPA